jgi:hypothetical protein
VFTSKKSTSAGADESKVGTWTPTYVPMPPAQPLPCGHVASTRPVGEKALVPSPPSTEPTPPSDAVASTLDPQ